VTTHSRTFGKKTKAQNKASTATPTYSNIENLSLIPVFISPPTFSEFPGVAANQGFRPSGELDELSILAAT
jgi:hypothetical protein